VNLADAADAMREAGLLDSPLGSNAWAFGKDTTANGSGLLLGNPHFPVGRRQPLLAGAPDHTPATWTSWAWASAASRV
jgi:acyl-homoserine lactone acylase PvdQ